MTANAMRTLVLVLLSVAMAGCSWFSWLPWVEGKEDKVDPLEPAELVKFKPEVEINRNWRGKIGEGLGKKYLRLHPAIVADRIIAADGYGVVSARDRFTGKRIWEVKVHELDRGFFASFNFIDRRDPSFVGGGVGAGGGMALVGTTFGEVVALDVSDGAVKWRTELGSEVLSIPSVADGLVFAQTIDGRLVALDQDSGEVEWTYDNQVPVLTLRGTSSPVVSNDIVYTGFASGKVSALNSADGQPIWEHRVMLPQGRSELDRIVDVDGRPLITGGSLFIGAYQGRVTGLSLRDGRPRWEQDISTYLDLTEGYGQVYVVDDEDIITAVDQQTGEVVWTQESFKRRRLSAPLAFSNYIVVGDEEGYLHVIAQRDGRLMARRKLDGDGIRSGMIYADSTLYVQGNSGSLHALQIETKD